jgi:hypothetical protein
LTPTYLYDCRLPFGASRSCRIFQALSDSIVRLMKSRNVDCISYIDDFMVVGDSLTSCQFALNQLIEVIEQLGFTINWNKVAGPDSTLTFLGVQIDCVSQTLSLPPEKLLETRNLLNVWVAKNKATKRDLQRLVGKLNWCSRVVYGGRTFLRNLIHLMSKLKSPHHHVRLTKLAKQDLYWWVKALDLFHGTTPFGCDRPLPSHVFATDTCVIGGGGHYGSDWFHVNWGIDLPEVQSKHINVLELETVLIAAEL